MQRDQAATAAGRQRHHDGGVDQRPQFNDMVEGASPAFILSLRGTARQEEIWETVTDRSSDDRARPSCKIAAKTPFSPRFRDERDDRCGLFVADLEDRDAARRAEAWQSGDDREIRDETVRPGIERGGGFVVVDLG